VGQPSIAVTGETFLKAPRAKAGDLGPEDVGVIGIGHELTKISRPGVAYGPKAIRDATQMVAWSGAVSMVDGPEGLVDIVEKRAFRWDPRGIYDLGDVPVGPDLTVNRERIEKAVQDIADTGAMPMILGGDHYLTHPAATGVVKANPGKNLAFLSLDMHLDLADEFPEWGRFNGGTYLRRLIDEGSIEGSRVIVYGVEPTHFREQWEFVMDEGITVIPAQKVFERGVEATLRPALEKALDGADGMYATLDIDAGARSQVPGTGNQNGVIGLSAEQMVQTAAMLKDMPLKGVDVTELSPPLDPSGFTAGMVAVMMLSILEDRLYQPMDYPDRA
jgi:agmatinase